MQRWPHPHLSKVGHLPPRRASQLHCLKVFSVPIPPLPSRRQPAPLPLLLFPAIRRARPRRSGKRLLCLTAFSSLTRLPNPQPHQRPLQLSPQTRHPRPLRRAKRLLCSNRCFLPFARRIRCNHLHRQLRRRWQKNRVCGKKHRRCPKSRGMASWPMNSATPTC